MSREHGRRDSAAKCLQFPERPVTPKAVRKYRKSYFAEPGSRVAHHGLIDDHEELRERLSSQRLGSRSNKASEHVNDLFAAGNKGALGDYVEQRKESIYKTVQREPLGKPYVRGHNFDSLGEETKLADSSESAKGLIYSGAVDAKRDADTTERVRQQYIKSHNSFEPGEQRRRNYSWQGIDPNTHRFGSAEAKTAEGVADCLQQPLADEASNITNIAVANHRMMRSDRLGKPKYRGNLDADTVRRLEENAEARKRAAGKAFSAQDCIEGDYTFEQQMADDGLGRATRPGWRNTTTSRVFGAPTVRTDIPAPTTRSVSDNQNYGDDTTARTLLYPSRFVAEGVEDADFFDPAMREDIQDIVARIGYAFSDYEFDQLYRRACFEATGLEEDNGTPVVSIRIFLGVMNERLRCLDEGREPSWWN